MEFFKRKAILLLVISTLLPGFTPSLISVANARPRVLAGSETEKKMKKKVKSLLSKARKLSNKGQTKEAIDLYWKIMEIDSNAAAAYLELGSIYADLKLNDRAIELLEPGLELLENESENLETISEFYCLLTMLYFEKKAMGKASQNLIKAAKLAPASPAPRKILGDIYLSRGRTKDAIKAYKKAVELDPNYQPAIKKLGEIARQNKFASETPRRQKVEQARKTKPAIRPVPVAPEKVKPAIKIAAKEEKQNSPVTETISPIIPIRTDKNWNKPTQPLETKLEDTSTTSQPQTEPRPVPTALSGQQEPNKVAPIVDERDIELAEAQKAKREFKGNIDTVVDKLLIGSIQEKAEATEKLISLGDKGLHALEDLLYDSDPDVRIIAIRSLGQFSDFKNRVKVILQDSIDDPDPEVKKVLQSTLENL